MGMAAGLIRQRCDEETNVQLQTIPDYYSCYSIFKDDTVNWKKKVDICSLLIVSIPLLSLVWPDQYLPRLGLLANVVFVLPQLIVITGTAPFLGSFPFDYLFVNRTYH